MPHTELKPWPKRTAPANDMCAEDERLSILASYGTDALTNDDELNDIVKLAARLCNVPTALVSVIEAERQLFLARQGLGVLETPRSWSFCAHAMLGARIMIVRDASEHPMFRDNPLVTGEPHIRFYAGAPIISREGAPMGTLCVVSSDRRPAGLTEDEIEGLEVLAQAVKRRLEAAREDRSAASEMEDAATKVKFMLDSVPDVAWSAAPGGDFQYFNARWTEMTGTSMPRSLDDWRKVIHPEDYEENLSRFRRAVKIAQPFEDEWRLRMADGSYRWMLSRAVPSTSDPDTAMWFGTLTDIDEKFRLSEERAVLAGELAHRIKNIFAVISGLISLRARADEKYKAFADQIGENIRALARAQEYVQPGARHTRDRLLDLLSALMTPYGDTNIGHVAIFGDPVAVGPKSSTPLALIFHELATNSTKYGALGVAEGRVAIETMASQGNVQIQWRESGGPKVVTNSAKGFGSRLIKMSVEHQLGGTLEEDWREEGLIVTLSIPEERLSA